MIAVRYVSMRQIDGRWMQTYQGRVSLPTGGVPVDASGIALAALRPVGYAEVEVPEKTRPDAIRALLEAEYRAGRWWVYLPGDAGQPPRRALIGVPLDRVTAEFGR